MQRTQCFAGTRQSQPLGIRIVIPSVLGVAHAARLRGPHDGRSTADDLSNDIANDGDDPAVLLLAMANRFAYGQTTGDYKENDLRVLSPCERCGAQLPTALSRATNLPLNGNGLRNLIWKGFVAVCPTCAACCLHNDDKNELHASVVRALEETGNFEVMPPSALLAAVAKNVVHR